MMIEVQFVTSFVVLLLGLVNAWLIWLATEARKQRSDLQEQITALSKSLSEFKEKVAREHVTTDMLTKVEERVLDAINRLGDRLDRVFDPTRKS